MRFASSARLLHINRINGGGSMMTNLHHESLGSVEVNLQIKGHHRPPISYGAVIFKLWVWHRSRSDRIAAAACDTSSVAVGRALSTQCPARVPPSRTVRGFAGRDVFPRNLGTEPRAPRPTAPDVQHDDDPGAERTCGRGGDERVRSKFRVRARAQCPPSCSAAMVQRPSPPSRDGSRTPAFWTPVLKVRERRRRLNKKSAFPACDLSGCLQSDECPS